MSGNVGAIRISNNQITTERSMTDDPNWLNPASDRKTPYTDEELDELVEGFIKGLGDAEWSALKSKYGEDEARKNIKSGLMANDERNLINIEPKGGAH